MSPLFIAILIYIGLVIGIYSFRPKFCFDNKGGLKKFGIGKNKTPFTFLSVSVMMGIFAFIIAIIYSENVQPVIENVLEEIV